MELYAEYIVGGIKNRNHIYRVGDFKLNGNSTDCYRSIFLFDRGLLEWVNKTGSVKGYIGNHIADGLVFDFDGNDLGDVKDSAVDFVQHLNVMYDIPIEYIRIAFSGNKGFHIVIPFEAVKQDAKPGNNFYLIYKNIAEEIVGGLKYADRSIYEIRRVLRISNTRHSESGLYKIPLTYKEFIEYDIDKIRALASAPRKVEHLPISELTEIATLADLFVKHRAVKSEPGISINTNNYSKILQGVESGERSNAAIKLVGHYLRLGMRENEILEHILLWNERNKPPMELEQIESEVRGACQRYAEPIDTNLTELFYTTERGFNEKYKIYVRAGQNAVIKTGFVKIDEKMRGLRRGEVLGIIGKTGNAKSALIQNIGHKYAKESKEPVLFFSLEMPIVSVVERSFQIETGLAGYYVENETLRYVMGEPSAITNRLRIVFDSLASFYTVEKGGLTIENIKQIVRFGEENIYGRKTGMVMIDYLSLLKSAGRDMFEQTARLARELKDAAKELDVPVIFLSQVTKNKSQTDELELDSGRDSGAIAEGADFIMGLWKTSDNENSIGYSVGLLKNRRGKIGKVSVLMDKRSLVFTEVGDMPPEREEQKAPF